jgi:hypothetical protein
MKDTYKAYYFMALWQDGKELSTISACKEYILSCYNQEYQPEYEI